MAFTFVPKTDNRGRILGFSPEGSAELTPPMAIGEEYAGERVEHKDGEYEVDEHGNLIHPSVKLPKGMQLGQGILLGEGVEFLQDGEAEEPGQIDSYVLIPGKTLLYSGISLGHHTILRASHFGRNSSTGSYARILEGAGIGSNVKIGSSVRLGKEVTVCEGATIEDNVYISGNGYVDPGVTIGHNCKIKSSSPNSLAAGISVHIREDMPPKTALPNLR